MKESEKIIDQEWRGVEFADLKENVASMLHEDRDVISLSEGTKPIKTCASQIGWARRPRYYGLRNFNIYDDEETQMLETDDF